MKPSAAELLLDIARGLKHAAGIVSAEGMCAPDNYTEVVALALRLRANPTVALRAQVEEWNKLQIVRELW